MTRAFKILYLLPVFVLTLVWCGCTDPNGIIDQNTEITNHNWSYTNLVGFTVNIDDYKVPYNVYLNLRVTGDYKYSNIFLLIHETGPDGKTATTRYEFKLANTDGEWLGEGSGNLYSYQIPFLTNYFFLKKGAYRFELEQNMRDNPLHEVSDVGLRVEKVSN